MLAADCSTTASVQVEGGSWRTLQGVALRQIGYERDFIKRKKAHKLVSFF